MATAVAPVCGRRFFAVPSIADLLGCVELLRSEKLGLAAQSRCCPVRKIATDLRSNHVQATADCSIARLRRRTTA
jgi:hypothetical protein